jgi:hypothetical protein
MKMNEDEETRELPPGPKLYVEKLRSEGNGDMADAYEDLYEDHRVAREQFIKDHLGGDVTTFYKASKQVRDEFHSIASDIVDLQRIANKATNYGRTAKQEALDNLDFMNDPKLVYRQQKDLLAGWYQSLSAELFYYDGVIWDKIPKERINELEYLG